VAPNALTRGAVPYPAVRACPFCAEQIQDAAIVCRFCGRDVAPVGKAATNGSTAKPLLPTQRWYAVDERVKRPPTREGAKPRQSIWAKIGGALEVFGPKELRPARPGRRAEMVREYASVSKYQSDVDRLIPLGWVIDHQEEDSVNTDGDRIVVTWVRGGD
jgi:hypothetical protein